MGKTRGSKTEAGQEGAEVATIHELAGRPDQDELAHSRSRHPSSALLLARGEQPQQHPATSGFSSHFWQAHELGERAREALRRGRKEEARDLRLEQAGEYDKAGMHRAQAGSLRKAGRHKEAREAEKIAESLPPAYSEDDID